MTSLPVAGLESIPVPRLAERRRVRDLGSVFLDSMCVIVALGLVRQPQLRFQSRDRQRLTFMHFLDVVVPIEPSRSSVSPPRIPATPAPTAGNS